MEIGGISNLARVVSSGTFAVTAEIGPPISWEREPLEEKASLLDGTADAFNVTDCQTAVVRMSSAAASAILVSLGLEPVMQMTCRDRNRIAAQADLLGAAALGVRNCLFISGDHQSFGAIGKRKGHPGSKNVYDLDSIQVLSVARGMRDGAVTEGGDPIESPLPVFIGAAWSPLADPVEIRTIRLAKKISAGADFIQTQAVYDIEAFEDAMERARAAGLTDRAAILAGVIVPKSAGMLRYMDGKIPGVSVPRDLIERMEGAKDPKEEGIMIAVELVHRLREVPGLAGIHIQAIEAEERIRPVIEGAGLLPRPQP